jgi:hypothetical protein
MNLTTGTPSLSLTDLNGQSISYDSIKFTLKSVRKVGSYLLTLSGGSTQKDLTSIAVSGSGTLSVGGLPPGFARLPNGTYKVIWTPTAPGASLLHFTMVDDNKEIREVFLNVATFDNLPPVARLQITSINQIASSEYLFDAGNSYDKDGPYGGYIANYQFTIGDKVFSTTSSSMKWIFTAPGTYIVGLKVTDGDGASQSISNTLIVK